MIKSLKDTPYWNIWADCCSLHKKFHGTSETDDTKWTELINEAGNIRNKYKNLQVRVCGWNVLWNNLSRAEQDAYITRAENIVGN